MGYKYQRARTSSRDLVHVTLRRGTRSAINAVRGKQSMAEFAREAIAREIKRRLTEAEKRK
jgi:hypothetical protein